MLKALWDLALLQVCAIVHMVMSPRDRSWLQQDQIGRG